jgi:hypothetical protein
MKIILCDFDDVLNSERTHACWGWGPTSRPNRSDGWGHNIEDPRLDPVAVALVRKLCETTGAKIVLTTTWREYYTIQAFIDMFSKYYDWHDVPIIDKTKQVRMNPSRSCEIIDWLEDHPEVTHYVILDDQWLSFRTNFVRVEIPNGLSYDNYLDALKWLEGEPSGNSVFV